MTQVCCLLRYLLRQILPNPNNVRVRIVNTKLYHLQVLLVLIAFASVVLADPTFRGGFGTGFGAGRPFFGGSGPIGGRIFGRQINPKDAVWAEDEPGRLAARPIGRVPEATVIVVP